VGPKVFTSPEIEIAVDIAVVTASFRWIRSLRFRFFTRYAYFTRL
jgi:hypothetical protein